MDELIEKVHRFLGEGPLYEHSLAVANTAQELAKKYGENPSKAFVAGLFHDVGGIIPVEKRIKVAEISGINLLPEELEAPMLIHQKISQFLTRWKFGIFNDEILSAIGCHTTLKAQFSKLDLIVFLADKISWDGGDNAPFKAGLLEHLQVSPESAALYYIDFILDHGVQVVHPWLKNAKSELEKQVK